METPDVEIFVPVLENGQWELYLVREGNGLDFGLDNTDHLMAEMLREIRSCSLQ